MWANAGIHLTSLTQMPPASQRASLRRWGYVQVSGHLSAPADPHLLEAIFLSTQSKGPRASPCPDRLTKPMAQRSCCQLLWHNTHGRTVRQLRGLPTDGCNQYFNCKVTLGDKPTHEASKGEGLRVIWAHMSLLRNGPLHHQQPQSPPKLCSH